MLRVAFEWLNRLPTADSFEVSNRSQYSLTSGPVLLVSFHKVIFHRRSMPLKVEPFRNTFRFWLVCRISENDLCCEGIRGRRNGAGILLLDFFQSAFKFLL